MSIDSDADAFERSLIDSGKRERMPAERKAALALVLGASAPILTASSAAATKAGAGAVVAAEAKASLGMTTLVKWIAGTVVAAAASFGGARMAIRAHETKTAAADAPAERAIVTDIAGQVRPPAVEETAPAAAELLTSTAAALPDAPGFAPSIRARTFTAPSRPGATREPSPDPGSSTSTPAAPASTEDAPSAKASRPSLTEELRAVERARAALATRNTDEASRALDLYFATFPDGSLSDEARVLQIDLLVQRGDRANAGRTARAFLATHPQSPHAGRLRDLLGEP